MVDLVIKNGRVITPNGEIYGGLGVEGSIITSVGSNSSLPRARKIIDAHDHFVEPVHSHSTFLCQECLKPRGS